MYEHINAYPPHVLPVFFQEIRKQEWTAIIPNSQLIVIPFPHDKPRRYMHTMLPHTMQSNCPFFLVYQTVICWETC